MRWLLVFLVACGSPHERHGFVPPNGFVPPTQGGLAVVTHDSTLTGSGTSDSPLGVTTVATGYSSVSSSFYEDWMQRLQVTTTGTQMDPVFECLGVGTGAVGFVSDSSGSSGRPGVGVNGTGTTNTGRALCSSSLAAFALRAGDTYKTRWVGGFPVLSGAVDGYSYTVGFFDTGTAINQANGCYFLYDERKNATAPTSGSQAAAGVQELNCECAAASSRTEYPMDGVTVSDESFTTVNAPVAALTLPNTNVLNLQVVITGTTRAEFFVNGVKSCDINTHIPSANFGAGFMIIKNVGTTNIASDFDFSSIDITLGSARSP